MSVVKNILISLVLLAGFASYIPAQTPTVPVPATMFGTHLHTAGTSAWPTVSVGGLGHSTSFSWVYIEPNAPISGVHTYNWTSIDYWVNLAAAHGAKYIWSQSGIPRWAAADVSTCTLTPVGGAANSECTGEVASANIADWDAFAAALVTRYVGKIPMYELWGEPYNSAGYTGSIAHMVVLTQHMHDAIRANDPTALVGSQTIFGYNTTWPNAFYTAGGTTDVDVVTTHGEPGSTHGESIMGSLSSGVRSVMAAHGMASKPVWDTEAEPGVVLTSDQEVAWVATSYILHWSVGFVRQYWYGWDYGDAGDALVGTASATAYQQVHDWMVGATMSTCSSTNTGTPYNSTYTCQITRSGAIGIIAWNSGGSASYTPPLGYGYASYLDLSGVSHPISGSSVPLTASPIYLVPPPPLSIPAISSFTSSPGSISVGGKSILSWTATGATSLSISPYVGTVTGLVGNHLVRPKATTTFTLTAKNSAGSSTTSTTVTVNSFPYPVISSFTTNISTITVPGTTATLSWVVTGYDNLSIDKGIGPVKGSSVVVRPTITTTYTLTATNGAGPSSRTVTITVNFPPPPPPPGPGPGPGPLPPANLPPMPTASGTVYYVAVSGSDGNPGPSPSCQGRSKSFPLRRSKR